MAHCLSNSLCVTIQSQSDCEVSTWYTKSEHNGRQLQTGGVQVEPARDFFFSQLFLELFNCSYRLPICCLRSASFMQCTFLGPQSLVRLFSERRIIQKTQKTENSPTWHEKVHTIAEG